MKSALMTDNLSASNSQFLYDVNVNSKNIPAIVSLPLKEKTKNHLNNTNTVHHEYPIIWEIRTYMSLILILSFICVFSICWSFMQNTIYGIIGIIPALLYSVYLWNKIEHSFNKQKLNNLNNLTTIR